MQIKTKYNVGDLIWVPRCYQTYEREELNFEGETWFKDVPKLKAIAKKKRIVKIEASVNEIGKVHISYYLINEDEGDGQMASVYAEDLIHNYTEEEALKIAKDYEQREEPYYGV
jgi:hypothetical protein